MTAILLACAPLVFGCGEKDDGPCGGCSTSRTVGGGHEIPGALSARAEGSIELEGEVATIDAGDALARIDAGPFTIVVSDDEILVYSTLSCTTCDASVLPGDPHLVVALVFADHALAKPGEHDVAQVMSADVELTGTIEVRETSPRDFVLDVTIEGRGTLKLEYVERRGPSTTTPPVVECYGSYG